MEGWIKLHRRLIDDGIWLSEPFTRGQAWVDLLMLANHDYSFFYKRGNKVEVNRGQIGRSEIELSCRWKWSRTKLRKFLNTLEKEQQIMQHKTQLTLIVTIKNYEIYQQKEQQIIQQKDNRKTTEEQQKNTYKNDKNEKNIKNDKKEEEKKEKKESLIFPFSGSEFLKNWGDWIMQSQNKKKSDSAKQKTLNRLAKYPEEFANELLEIAIASEYQGCVFPDTPKKYNDWKKINPETGRQFSKTQCFTDFQNLGNNGTDAGF